MTAPLDGELAWAISSWGGPDRETPLSREDVESLARHLTDAGFVKPVTSSELSLGDLRKLADKAQNSLSDFLRGPRGTEANSTA